MNWVSFKRYEDRSKFLLNILLVAGGVSFNKTPKRLGAEAPG